MDENLILENNSADAPPIDQDNKPIIPPKLNNEFLICPECSSALEIISIDEENNMLEFRCTKYNHRYNKISIIRYLFIIKRNKKPSNLTHFNDKCEFHKNNNYSCFCFDCNRNICNECLKSGDHMDHRKNILIEIQPDEQHLKVINEIIQNNKNKLDNLVKEKELKTKELNEELSNEKLKEQNLLNNKIKYNKKRNDAELDKNNKEYIAEIKEIKKKYEEEIKKAKIKYMGKNNKINNKFKSKNDEAKIKCDLQIERLKALYNNKINNFQFDSKIEKLEGLIKLNEKVFNTYKQYKDNYFNSININNLLVNYTKNKSNNEILKKTFGKGYNILIKALMNKYNKEISVNKKIKEIKELENKKHLENIKSNDTFNKLFSYLNEKIKLKIIKYNKNAQSKINVNLINYKFFSKKYIVYESKIKGKEYYYDDTLLFEGEYLNGERNGKGKEYNDDGELEYEGEYLNGKRNGKGKEYDYDGNLEFEGEYLDGKRRNGKGKEYNKNKLEFEGEYYNGERWNGKGKKYDYNGKLIFEGEYLNGKRNGKCTEYDSDGKLIFEGEYLNGNIFILKTESINDILNYDLKKIKGLLKEYYSDGKLKFEGEYLNGKRNGKGKEYDYDGNLEFEGEYLNGEKWNGKGKEYYSNDNIEFEGEYLNGKRNGKGKEYD